MCSKRASTRLSTPSTTPMPRLIAAVPAIAVGGARPLRSSRPRALRTHSCVRAASALLQGWLTSAGLSGRLQGGVERVSRERAAVGVACGSEAAAALALPLRVPRGSTTWPYRAARRLSTRCRSKPAIRRAWRSRWRPSSKLSAGSRRLGALVLRARMPASQSVRASCRANAAGQSALRPCCHICGPFPASTPAALALDVALLV